MGIKFIHLCFIGICFVLCLLLIVFTMMSQQPQTQFLGILAAIGVVLLGWYGYKFYRQYKSL